MAADPAGFPQPTAFTTAVAGETWGFQLWHRDSSPTGPTTNLTQAPVIGYR